MKATRFLVLVLVLALLMTLSGAAAAQEPQPSGGEGVFALALLNTGCVAGSSYDPACDVNRDGATNVVDLQLVATHWGQTGTWTSDYWSLTGNAGTDPSNNFLGTTDNQPLVIKTNNAEAMRINESGNVGIGAEENLEARLTVSGVGDALTHGSSAIYVADSNKYFDFNAGLIFRGTGNHWSARFTSTSDMDDDGEILGVYREGPNPGDLGGVIAVFNNNGNVGIGTTEPETKLEVDGDVRVGTVTEDDGSTEGYGDFLYFSGGDDWPSWDSDNSDPLWIARYNVDDNISELRIGLGDDPREADRGATDRLVIGAERDGWHPRMTVLATGEVGIGTTEPDVKLDVLDGSGNPQLRLTRTDGSLYTDFRVDEFGNLEIEPSGGVVYVNNREIHMWKGANLRTVFSVDSNSYITGGNVGIGTTTPESTLQVVGNYIQFPTITGGPPPAADCDEAVEAGRVVVRTDGTTNLYVCTGTTGWVGK